MYKRQLLGFRSLKIYHVLTFLAVFPQYQSWSQVCFSSDAYMAIREWGSPMPMSAGTNREGWRETASLSTANSAYYYRRLIASVSHLFSP